MRSIHIHVMKDVRSRDSQSDVDKAKRELIEAKNYLPQFIAQAENFHRRMVEFDVLIREAKRTLPDEFRNDLDLCREALDASRLRNAIKGFSGTMREFEQEIKTFIEEES